MHLGVMFSLKTSKTRVISFTLIVDSSWYIQGNSSTSSSEYLDE